MPRRTWSARREKPTAVAAAWARALIVGTLLTRSTSKVRSGTVGEGGALSLVRLEEAWP